ncbi:MAG: hypothetical protein FP831_16615 [Anaerolineae bacterium]|nr:hypothetical protein [Anaerolineae bacterium]
MEELTLEGVSSKAFLVLSFDDKVPKGKVEFHKDFFATGEYRLVGLLPWIMREDGFTTWAK